MSEERKIAYLSMEISLESGMPTYSGGLGILAGDTIVSAANLKVPMVAVSLLHRKGYFYQKLDASGWQTEDPVDWPVDDFLEELPERITITLEGRDILLRCGRHNVVGFDNFIIPVYFIDSDLPGNSEWDRTLTHDLYGGDVHYRLCQEVILGIGGVRMLRALGYNEIKRFHLNEGHASLLTIELLNELQQQKGSGAIHHEDLEKIRQQCVFTTHSPVPAGHDQFPMDLVYRIVGSHPAFEVKEELCCNNVLNMTHLALSLRHYINGVAKKHRDVSRKMFTNYVIDSIILRLAFFSFLNLFYKRQKVRYILLKCKGKRLYK